MLAIWFCAWGMWSYKTPYFADDIPYSYKMLDNDSFSDAFKKTVFDRSLHTGIGYFARPLDPVYLWFAYRLGTPLHKFIIAFFHFMAAYFFWILLYRIKIPYSISILIASVFLVMPITYESIYIVGLSQPLHLLLFLLISLLFLNFRRQTCFRSRFFSILALNFLLFFVCLSHPSFISSIILITVFEMILSLKESVKWRSVIERTMKTGLLLSIGPAIYAVCYMTFPHANNPHLSLLKIFHVFLSVQYHGCRALLSMFSLEWISEGFAALTSSLSVFLIFIASGIIFYLSCFHVASRHAGETYTTRHAAIDFLWGYLWMISGFAVYMLDVGFASNSRSYYFPSLGIAIMAGSIFNLLFKRVTNKRIIYFSVFVCIMTLVFFACGISYDYDGTPLFWKAALNRKTLHRFSF